jgi:predicted Ser/Thr protein kinase
LGKDVALKIEKKDKNKNILLFEYQVLKQLEGKRFLTRSGLKHICNVYDFVYNTEQNLVVMDLLGKFTASYSFSGSNLAKVRKCLEDQYSLKIAINLLVSFKKSDLKIEMLDAI